MKGQITPHFAWAEACCKCGCRIPQRLMPELEKTAWWAEGIREALGGRPMQVLSWYRCARWNAYVGGAPASQHLLGRAIDFLVRDLTPAKVQLEIVRLRIYPTQVRGLGKYAGWTHIDRRDGPAYSWTEHTRSLRRDAKAGNNHRAGGG